MGQKGQEAKALFEQGYNCAQSVAGVFAEEMGLPVETVLRLASPFGGGMGRMREVCGAVSGMLLALGMLRGYNDPRNPAEKRELYALVQQLAGHFREKNGSIVCHELLGLDKGPSEPTPEARTETYYKKRPCGELICCSADILADYLRENPPQDG